MKFLLQRLTLLIAFLSVGTFAIAQTAPAENTVLTFTLTDSFGDGWCGGNLIVSGEINEVTGADGACTPIVEAVPFTKPVGTLSGFTTGTGPFDVLCPIAPGSSVSITWMDDPFNGETGYTLTDVGGNVLLTGGGGSGLPGVFTPIDNTVVPPAAPMACAATLNLTDSFGDGWNGASIEWTGDMGTVGCVGGDNSVCPNDPFDGGTTFTEKVTALPGETLTFMMTDCGTFSGEVGVDILDADGVSVGGFGPGGCAAGTPLGMVTAPPLCVLPCPADTTVVLADGDCWPIETYVIPCDIAFEDLPMVDFACPGFTADPVGLDIFNNPVPQCSSDLFDVDVDNNIITMMTSNGPGGTTGCDDETCPGATFPNSGLSLTTVPVNIPAGYSTLTVDYSLTPDCTGNYGEDQFSYFITDASGTTVTTIVFLIAFGNSGDITGTETIDLTGLPAGAKIGFYMLSNAAPGINGPATVELEGVFSDNTGGTFFVGASNDSACDSELAYELDPATGELTIEYIPGVNEICWMYVDEDGFVFDCSYTFTVDNSDIKQALACNDHVNISVDQDCEALITADMVLEGGPYYGDCEYIVEITTTTGIPVDNPIVFDPDYGSNEYVVSVIDPYTCNTCWGTVTLEDKLAPTIECPCPEGAWITDPACQRTCLNMTQLTGGTVGRPTVSDNCAGASAVFGGAVVIEVGCGEYVVEQTWTVEIDGYQGGGFPDVTCTNQYFVTAVDLSLVTIPGPAEFECTDLGDPNLTHPDNTGYPRLGGDNLGTADNNDNPYCNIFATYTDLDLPACGLDCSGPTKILRTWTLLDWCTGDIAEFVQIIKVIDTEAPTVMADDVFTSTGPWECAADVWFEGITVHDNCSYDLDWYIVSTNSGATLVDEDGRTNSNKPKQHALGVPKGEWEFVIGSWDCCGNLGQTTITVTVADLAAPVAISTQNLVVSLTSGGTNGDNAEVGEAKIFYTSIDNGSFDNCSGVGIEIRRDNACAGTTSGTYSNKIPAACDPWYDSNDHDYGEHVVFCCDDLAADGDGDGEADGLVKVWMRVWDDANMDGVYGSYTFYDNPGSDHDYCEFDDNFNETWSYVKVEDKGVPNLICPPNITISCDWDYTDLTITGNAAGSATCGTAAVAHQDWAELHCGEGYVLREWYLDLNGNGEIDGTEGEYTCTQTITVENVTTLPLADRVICPTVQGSNKVIVDCADYNIPDPFITESACSLAGISSDIDTFWFEEGACYKVIKTWTILDWCTGEEFACDFTVSLIDSEAPEIMCADTCIGVDDFWDADGDGNYCEFENNITLMNSATDGGDCGSPWIKWIIEVDYWADGVDIVTASSFVPPSASNYKAPTAAGAPVSMTLLKDDASAAWARHIVKWKAFDGCGNVSQCTQVVEVGDKKAPTPYCIGISTALMDSDPPLVEIWANDFNLGSFDNCSTEDQLLYTFDETAPNVDKLDQEHCFDATGEVPCSQYENGFPVQKWNPATGTSGTKFVGDDWCGENDIRVSVWDAKFNTDFCWVTLIIHGEVCDDQDMDDRCGECYTDNLTSGIMGISDDEKSVFRFNPATGDFTSSPVNNPPNALYSFAVNPANADEYYISGPGGNIFRGDFVTGDLTDLGNVGAGSTILGLDFTPNGELFAVTQNLSVFEIDLTNATSTFLFTASNGNAFDLTVDPNDGTFWISGADDIIQHDASGNVLQTFDTPLARGITIEDCGIFYFCNDAGINVFDPQTGINSQIYDLGGGNCNDLDSYTLDDPLSTVFFREVDCVTGDFIGNFDNDGNEYTIRGCLEESDDCEAQSAFFFNIAGDIETELGERVANVTVTNTSPQPEYPRLETTDGNGEFAFIDNVLMTDYEITAEKNDDWLNGVSTLDLVMIQRHILGLQNLDSAYKLIAADINSDENISGIDIVELRKLILGIYNELPQNNSWRFPIEDQAMGISPFPFVEAITISELSDNMMHENFIGVKIGDVNGSVVANISDINVDSRSANTVDFVTEALGSNLIEVRAGENFTNVYGYQFTMQLNGSLEGVRSGALNIDASNFGILRNGVVTTSFGSTEANTFAEGEVLFTLEVAGGTDLSLVSGVTSAEAYVGSNLDVADVSMRGGNGEVAEFALAQNEPNPFGESTQIAFTLGKAGQATLTIMDVTGKVVTVVSGDYDSGTHVIELTKGHLGASGVMYYQLESGDFTATKKMIVIE